VTSLLLWTLPGTLFALLPWFWWLGVQIVEHTWQIRALREGIEKRKADEGRHVKEVLR
jgi:hypothetical protein